MLREKLAALNPEATAEDDLTALMDDERMPRSVAQTCQLTGGEVQRVIKKLPLGSAAGFFGWTFRLISQLVHSSPEHGMDLCDALANLFNMMLQGNLSAGIWISCRSVLVPKRNGGERPLAIGEAFYRIMGRTVMQKLGKSLGKQLRPFQLGCGTDGGAEIAARTAQLVYNSRDFTDTAIITFDIRNAFGSLPRSLMLEGILKRCPELAPWFI